LPGSLKHLSARYRNEVIILFQKLYHWIHRETRFMIEEDGCEEDPIPDIFDFCEPLEGNNEPSSTKNKSN
jgi:hypothetical protein